MTLIKSWTVLVAALLIDSQFVFAKGSQVVLDQVLAVMYQNDLPDFISRDGLPPDEVAIITQQDVARCAFDGQVHTKEDLVERKLLAQRSKKFKMNMSEEDFERHLDRLGLSEERLKLIAAQFHYASTDELKADLQEMFTANMALGFESEAALAISEEEILAYYDAHPIWLEPEYEVQIATVMVNDLSQQPVIQAKLECFIKTGKGYKPAWEDPIKIKQSEVSAHNQFLNNLKVGQVHLKMTDAGFDLFKVTQILPRRLQPLVERKQNIMERLREERYPKVVERVQANLLANSSVTYPKQYS